MEFDVEYYEALNGKQHVKEFLDELEKINRDLYDVAIGLITGLEDSQYHCLPTSKSLKGGLFELKCSFGNNTCRINWCKGGQRKVFLLNGYIKKGTSKQQREIKKARKLMYELKIRRMI